MPPPLLALIVDDDTTARELLRHKLSAFPRVKVIGEASTLIEGRKALAELQPDVLFLDIRLGYREGFELLDAVPEGCQVVFVTSYDEYAVQAFDVKAVDYITKPYDTERIAQTVARLRDGKSRVRGEENSFSAEDPLLVSGGESARLLRIDEISAILSNGGGSEALLSSGDRLRVSKPLKVWEARLPASQFLRISRSALINVRAVTGVERWFHGTYRIRIGNHPEPFTVGKHYLRSFLDHYAI